MSLGFWANKYMVMAHEREAWVPNAGEWEYIAVKCAKRRNDVYVSRVDSRLRGIGIDVPDFQQNLHEKPFTSMLFVTLTYGTKLSSFSEAWQHGFVRISGLDIGPETWTATPTINQIIACYVEWERVKHYD